MAHPYLGKQLRVTVSDQRVIQGVLEAVDGDKNLILSNTEDVTSSTTNSNSNSNNHVFLGIVVIPGQHVVGVAELELPSSSSSSLLVA